VPGDNEFAVLPSQGGLPIGPENFEALQVRMFVVSAMYNVSEAQLNRHFTR
jgi:hypothetical protein